MAEISETLIEDCVKSFTVLSSRVADLSDSVNQMKEKQKNMDIRLMIAKTEKRQLYRQL